MRRVKMLMLGATVLAFLFFFSAPKAHAQLLDGTTHDAKISSSAAVFVPMVGLVNEGGKETAPVVLKSSGPNLDTGGFDYSIILLEDMGPGPCVEVPIGMLSTYPAKRQVS